jgi:hypothetical protein
MTGSGPFSDFGGRERDVRFVLKAAKSIRDFSHYFQRRRLRSRRQHGAGELRVRCAIAAPAPDRSKDAKERALHY